MTHLKQKEAYYDETMETTGCPLIGNRHGSGNADVFPKRHPAKYPVGNFSKCRRCKCSNVDKNRIGRSDMDTVRGRNAEHQWYRRDERL